MSEILGPAVGYVELLDASLTSKSKKDSTATRTSSPLRPSSAGQCARRLAYEFGEYRGLTQPNGEVRDAATARLLELGNSVEYHVIKLFQNLDMSALRTLIPDLEVFKVSYKQQCVTITPLSDGSIVEGSLDLCFVSNKFKGILDVKSKKDKFSSWSSSNWSETGEKLAKMKSVEMVNDSFYWIADLPAFLDELKDPFLADNFYQLNLYATTDFIKERKFDHAAVLQYNKNDSRMRELRFKPSDEIAQYVKDKFAIVQESVDQRQDPESAPREAQLGSIRCAFCPFSRRCWGDASQARQEYFDTFPNRKWPRDTDRLPIGQTIERLFESFTRAEKDAALAKEIEADICSLLDENKVQKIRLQDQSIWELKLLKSPKPHFELRRGKM